ncbi:hypothetical protein EJV46_16105 [Roseococcus sp. SYP-B2431]|uniref:phage/plasmid primase, P4 family n=1 Tax=Roseococcus sp. SYP-B2431 TaxID=2496640 RepID=UPI0010390887|nr:phage/plasmid primase, P4 family [Roseococcus sp. SYP-B2431]TCH97639.1 hypothetical protein EJV46_16105 [Roseococcus sp. SYP-B2431]
MDGLDPEARFAAAGARREPFAVNSPPPEAPQFSDDALALAFSDRHNGQLLYVPQWASWLRWDGCRWARDETLAVFDLARALCREQAQIAEDQKEDGASRIASASTVAAVERMARSDPRHARPAAAFDADEWLLNTPGGIVDLTTGATRPARKSELVTKVASVAPQGECLRFLKFLSEIVQEDEDLIAYLQRWAGYLLTGSTREHAFLVIVGPGGNGKTLLVNILAYLLGDYAATAPMETFMASAGDRHPTDLAGLRGARLVIAQETEAGRALAEAKIKTLTGGDPVSARFMRGDFFTYRPNFKLVMVGNHRPVIRNPDDALRRRLHLLPLTFKPAQPDAKLFDILKAEGPGILRWAIEGCLAWQQAGLGMPMAVKAATDGYFEDQDLLAQWLSERCEVKNGNETSSSALFRDWSTWCDQRGEAAGTGKRFSSALERHFAKKRSNAGMIFAGVRLLPSSTGAF